MENLNLLRKIAWSFYQTTHVDFKELFAEACLAYCEALVPYKALFHEEDITNCEILSNYTAEEGSLSSLVYGIVENRLINFTKKEKRYTSIDLPVESQKLICYQPVPFSETMMTLSKDCQKIADIMLTLIEEKKGESVNHQNKMILWEAKRRLIQDGWSHQRTNKGIKELKMNLIGG